jgi:porin
VEPVLPGHDAGRGRQDWQYGGKLDALARVDLAKLGLWNGLSVTAQYNFNYGHDVNGVGGVIGQVNTALAFPGIEGADRSDIMALYVTQRFGDLVSVSLGKLNMLEVVRARPLQGGIGTDTFWNVNLGPITGVTPPTLNGAQIIIRTEPVSYLLMIYDPLDATNRPLFSDLFHNGVTFNGRRHAANVAPWFRITGDVQFIRPGSANSPRSIFVGLGSYIRF